MQKESLLTAAAAFPGAASGDGYCVVTGDCMSVLQKMPPKSADLIFADPPYNLQLQKELYRPNMTRVAGVVDAWDKFASFAEYDSFCEKWLRGCRRVLKDDGAIWVIGTYHNIGRVARLLQDLDFWILNDVIWQKTNPMPNFRGVRFTNATETLLWAKKSQKGKYTFNHKLMKAENGGKQMTNVWSFSICGGAERLRNAAGDKLHSTQKPAALLRRIILSSTKIGDTVLDPFLGSGTTAAVARQLGRIGIGIERDKKYANIAVNRIGKVIPQNRDGEKLLLTKPARIPFAELLTQNKLCAGQFLYTKNGETKAEILKNGDIKINGKINAVGSIHRVGAKVSDKPSCNGWNFWQIKTAAGFESINTLRESARAKS